MAEPRYKIVAVSCPRCGMKLEREGSTIKRGIERFKEEHEKFWRAKNASPCVDEPTVKFEGRIPALDNPPPSAA